MTPAGQLLKPFFRASPRDLPPLDETRGATQRLHQVVDTVTECCQTTLFHPRLSTLVPKLDAYEEELRGFAYEGAGVGFAGLDLWLPWKRRTQDFIDGPGSRYMFAIYLGAGMGLARMHRDPQSFQARLKDPVFSWAVLDGYGFHEGFFAYKRAVLKRAVPAKLTGYARRAFDHGLGRSVWFTSGADVQTLLDVLRTFPTNRHADLWSGVGLACGYTGGVQRPTLDALCEAAGSYRPELALGVVVAAKARRDVGNPAEHNELACEVLCGLTSQQAAGLAETALAELPATGDEPLYETWRQRILETFLARPDSTDAMTAEDQTR